MMQMLYAQLGQLARGAVFGPERNEERLAIVKFAGKIRQISTYAVIASGVIIFSGLVTSHFLATIGVIACFTSAFFSRDLGVVSANVEEMIDERGRFRPEFVLANAPFKEQITHLVDAACKDTWIFVRVKDLVVPIITNVFDQAEPLLRQMLAR